TDSSQSSTVTAEGTEIGVVLGTPSYMSPEQARGRTVDKRTDIWAFGCVLFEVLARRRAFRGETTSDCMAAVLASQPDWVVLPASMPPNILALMRRCLEKDPRRRLRDIGDAAMEIDDALAGRGVSAMPAVGAAPSKHWSLPWTAAGFLAGALVAALA